MVSLEKPSLSHFFRPMCSCCHVVPQIMYKSTHDAKFLIKCQLSEEGWLAKDKRMTGQTSVPKLYLRRLKGEIRFERDSGRGEIPLALGEGCHAEFCWNNFVELPSQLFLEIMPASI